MYAYLNAIGATTDDFTNLSMLFAGYGHYKYCLYITHMMLFSVIISKAASEYI